MKSEAFPGKPLEILKHLTINFVNMDIMDLFLFMFLHSFERSISTEVLENVRNLESLDVCSKYCKQNYSPNVAKQKNRT